MAMGITVRDLLNVEYFKDFKVIAGHKGLNREIQGVTVADAPDGYRWKSEKELCFSSGYALANNPDFITGQKIDHVRPQVDGIHDLLPAPFYGLVFKKFSDAVEQHDTGGFRELLNDQGTQGCQTHQEIFIEDFTFDHVLSGGFQNFQTQNQVSSAEGNGGPPSRKQPA